MAQAVWILAWAALLQAVLFAGLLLQPRYFERYSNLLLIALLLVFAIEKGDAIFLSSGLALSHPQFVMIGNLFGALISPLIYFHIRSRTRPDFRIGWRHAWAFGPFLALILYAVLSYHRLDSDAQLALLTSGAILNPVNRLVIPLLGDAINLGFLLATYVALRTHDLNVRNWFATIENRTLGGIRTIVVLMAALILLHAIWTLSGSSGVGIVLYLSHFLMINALAIGAISARTDIGEAASATRPAAARAPTDEQSALLDTARTALTEGELYADPDLTVSRLARRMGLPQRKLSEAINTAGGTNFHVFVNAVRISEAQQRLLAHPDRTILDIAYDCGFNSKSTFNDAFRKLTGQTPSEYRAQA